MARPKGSKNSKPRSDKGITQFCPNGHDTFICGRAKNRCCNACARERNIQWKKEVSEGKRIVKSRKQFCIRKHDTFRCGRDKRGACLNCIEENKDKYREEHNAANRRYHKKYKIKVLAAKKKWKRENPGSIKASKIRQQTNRQLRVVVWTDWKEIKKIYNNCPPSLEVDHYIPVLGEYVAGLHVSWNLQYLTKSENVSKGNKCNLLEASEWYGKILEEAGLK